MAADFQRCRMPAVAEAPFAEVVVEELEVAADLQISQILAAGEAPHAEVVGLVPQVVAVGLQSP